MAVFSFHPVKIITSGEGGMAMTNDDNLAARMHRLRTHGITRNEADMARPPDGPWYYEQLDLGFNYRMTDIQAALGLSQLRRLGEFVPGATILLVAMTCCLPTCPLPRLGNTQTVSQDCICMQSGSS